MFTYIEKYFLNIFIRYENESLLLSHSQSLLRTYSITALEIMLTSSPNYSGTRFRFIKMLHIFNNNVSAYF